LLIDDDARLAQLLDPAVLHDGILVNAMNAAP